MRKLNKQSEFGVYCTEHPAVMPAERGKKPEATSDLIRYLSSYHNNGYAKKRTTRETIDTFSETSEYQSPPEPITAALGLART